MKIADFNIHLPDTSMSPSDWVKSEIQAAGKDIEKRLQLEIGSLMRWDGACNLMIFNSSIVNNLFLTNLSQMLPDKILTFTVLFNFRDENFISELHRLKNAGISFIKLHSYIQKISKSDFNKLASVFSKCEELKIGVCLDASYGTKDILKYDNLKLFLICLRYMENQPVVVLHFGGARVMHFALASLGRDNVYFDLSFSIDYFDNSRILEDLYFSMNKIGFEKFLFGTDRPYISSNDTLRAFNKFSEKFGITKDNQAKVLYGNFITLVDKVS